MKEIKLTSIQYMLPPDELAYELGLIPTPKEIEKNKIISYLLLGGLATLSIGFIVYTLYQDEKENKSKKLA
ncbi:hypothetical protein [Flavobacterium sp.]|jgi:hypothetical protein|uniref:hypothetical protein n=1 Tax=Flavobacterium sp. TaxID=239 RepID=UPI003783C0BD